MKVIHLAASDSNGGAARAAYRVHLALTDTGINSQMWVLNRGTDNANVCNVNVSRLVRLKNKLSSLIIAKKLRDWHTNNNVLHSFGQVSAGIVNDLNATDADIVNLHWIPGILSIKDIGRISKPVVWRFPDMWAFCGAEHYAPDTPTSRFRVGYLMSNRAPDEKGTDINRIVWNEKRRLWRDQKFTIICTTHWLAKCTRESLLFANTKIHIIPNPLDVNEIWKPVDKQAARIVLNLPLQKKLILMGTDWGLDSPYKGADLFIEAVRHLVSKDIDEFDLVIFGPNKPQKDLSFRGVTRFLGRIKDDRLLAMLYSAVDIIVVPSRQEAFGQVASEAQSCGTPVVAFDNSGIADIVIHRETGWLAKAFNTEDLAYGISWIIENEKRHAYISEMARRRAIERFSESVIARKYIDVYQQVLESTRKK